MAMDMKWEEYDWALSTPQLHLVVIALSSAVRHQEIVIDICAFGLVLVIPRHAIVQKYLRRSQSGPIPYANESEAQPPSPPGL